MGDYWARNFYAVAGTGYSAVSLPWRPRQLIVTNDSTAANLWISMAGGEVDLLPDETLSVEFQPGVVYVSGASWRLMGFG